MNDEDERCEHCDGNGGCHYEIVGSWEEPKWATCRDCGGTGLEIKGKR
jgi:DnaJ-class molecular chaperone